MTTGDLLELMQKTVKDLSTDEGILASGRNEVFGCIFGRDTAITILKLLKVYERQRDSETLAICRRSLLTLASLQGSQANLESGEEPGKFIHEFRRDRYQHLIERETPWYLYDDTFLRNYDSVDATPLALIAFYRYWELTGDNNFIQKVRYPVEAGLLWLIDYGDLDNDGLIEYRWHPERKFGGLAVQSWTDSQESFMRPDGTFPEYPLAPAEVQAFGWLALKLWAGYYGRLSGFGKVLNAKSRQMKASFNRTFVYKDNGLYFIAQALDGNKQRIETVTGNPLMSLWAAYSYEGKYESIIARPVMSQMVKRAFQDDMFDENAGIRTMSMRSLTYNPREDSYHNGSFWPMLNGLIYEGLVNFGYLNEAVRLREAALRPIHHFGSPIELYHYGKETGYQEYRSPEGQIGCREQAWSAASILQMMLTY